MSEEIKQVVHMSTGRPEAGRHYAALYGAAQVELAALREELASRNEVIAMKAREIVEAQTAVTGWASKCKAAEQRNATLTKALVDTREALGREYWDQYAGLDETRDILDAALKPTESGASE